MVSIAWKKHDLVGDIVRKLAYYSSVFKVFFLCGTSKLFASFTQPQNKLLGIKVVTLKK
jgi:hypothetical protein